MSLPSYTGADLYTLTTFLLGGEEIDTTAFYQMLNVCRMRREASRPWRVLIKTDTSQTASTADNYATAKTLPTDFVRTLDEDTIQLFDPNAGPTGTVYDYYFEVPYEKRLQYKDDDVFYIDHANSQFFICGTVPSTLTIYLNYIADFGDIASNSSWLKFPARFSPILAFDVAVMYKGGVDYDSINARMAQYNGLDATAIEEAMEEWDNQLALSAQRGQSRGKGGSGYRRGAINIQDHLG